MTATVIGLLASAGPLPWWLPLLFPAMATAASAPRAATWRGEDHVSKFHLLRRRLRYLRRWGRESARCSNTYVYDACIIGVCLRRDSALVFADSDFPRRLPRGLGSS
jgi:hypothetical protein